MHYKDGTPAKLGDLIIQKDAHYFGTEKIGIVTEIQSSETCNAQVHVLAKRQNGSEVWFPVLMSNPWSMTLSECVRAGPEISAAVAEPVTRRPAEKSLLHRHFG